MSFAKPSGLITALVTPLGNKQELDRDSLEKLLKTVTQENDAVLVNSNHAGEGAQLPQQIRKSLIKETMKIIDGRVTVLIGFTGDTVKETFENAKHVEELRNQLNYKGMIFLYDYPLFYHSNRGLPAHYEKLAEVTSLPLIISNNPGLISNLRRPLKRYNLRTGVLKKLIDSDRIVGLEHSGDLHRFLNYMKAARQRQDFCFYDGNESNFLNNPSTAGIISIGANLVPKQWKEVVDSSLHTDDSRKEDADYCRYLWETREKLTKLYACYGDNPVALVKAALKHSGVIASDTVAGKNSGATEDQKKKIYAVLDIRG